MKLSKSFIIKIIIYAAICIIVVGILPERFFHIQQTKTVDKSVETFHFYGGISDSIFYGDFSLTPSSIEGFDFELLQELGAGINVDFKDTIRRIKEPYGLPWITYALGQSIIGLVKQLAVTNLNSNFTNSMYSAVLSIVGFVVMIVFFLLFFPVKSIKRSVDNVSERNLFSGILFILSIVSVLLLFVIVAYTIMTSIPLSTGFITSPTSTFSGQLTLGIAFYLITAYFLFGILFAVFLVLHFFRSKQVGFRRLYSLILIIPIVAIGYNILSSTNRIEIINSMIDSHNLNMAGQLIRQDANDIVLNTRTMYLFSLEENDISLEDLNLSGIVSETDFGIYNLAVNGNLLTINGEGKYKNVIGEGVQVKTLFYADRDSINTQLIK